MQECLKHSHRTCSYIGTVVDLPEIRQTVLNYQQSRQYQSDRRGHIDMPIGTVSQLVS